MGLVYLFILLLKYELNISWSEKQLVINTNYPYN